MKEQYSNGLREFSRISGHNEQAIVDDIYIPTSADQKVYAHVSIESAYGKHDAGTDEAEVEILHTYKDGGSNLLTGKTIGKDQFPNQEVYEIYGKPVDPNIGAFGWVEIELPNNRYLEAGDTLEVWSAKVLDPNLDSENSWETDESNLSKEKRTVVEITPPPPTDIMEPELTEDTQVMEGVLTERDAMVAVEVNGERQNGDVEYNRPDRTFDYTFTEPLEVGDEVQVLLNDNTGIADKLGPEADRPNRPLTNNEIGNRNPRETFTYHDKVFYQAPVFEVKQAPGELTFVSAPDSLNFNVKVKPYTDDYLVDMDSLGKDLIIRDSRADTRNWQLRARMSQPLTAVDDQSIQLQDALFYREGQNEITLNEDNAVIVSHRSNESEAEIQEWNLSSDPEQGWGKGENGLFITIKPGTVKKQYAGEVTWTLSDAP